MNSALRSLGGVALVAGAVVATTVHAKIPAYFTSETSISNPDYCPAGPGDELVIDVVIRGGFNIGVPNIPASDLQLVCSEGNTGILADAPTDSLGHTTFTVNPQLLEDAGCCGDLYVLLEYFGSTLFLLPVLDEGPLPVVAPLASVPSPGPQSLSSFATAIAMTTSRFAVGQHTFAGDTGVVWIFERSTGALLDSVGWPDGTGRQTLGAAVAFSDDALVAGAPYDDPEGRTDAGSVLVWDRETLELRHEWPNPVPLPGDRFGQVLATRGTDIVVAAPHDTFGSVRVFDGTTGEVLLLLQGSGPEEGFGSALTVAAGNIVVGYPRAEGHAGVVLIYHGTTGELLHELHNPLPQVGVSFGAALASTPDGLVIVGSSRANWNGNEYVGVAHVFDGATGQLLLTMPSPVAPQNVQFGTRVAASGDHFFVTAPNENHGEQFHLGGVFVFDHSGELIRSVHPTGVASMENFGQAIAVDDTGYVVGARTSLSHGRVYVFGPAATEAPFDIASGATMSLRARPVPFRASTSLDFSVPTFAADLRVSVFDVAGRNVRDLWSGSRAAGRHTITWDGRNRDLRTVPAGVYFVRLQVGGEAVTRKVVRVD